MPIPLHTDNQLLEDISKQLQRLNSQMQIQNIILCKIHGKKLPKRLLRCVSPDVMLDDEEG